MNDPVQASNLPSEPLYPVASAQICETPESEPRPDTYGYPQSVPALTPPRATPGLGDLGIFVLLLIGSGVITILAGGILVGLRHHAGDLQALTKQQMLAIAIPAQAIWYALAYAALVLVFRMRWHQPFARGVHWNGGLARLHWGKLMLTGVGLALVVGLASTKIPMPKDAPIDELFKSPALAWMALVFGVFVAPAAEELAFRGFLLPSLRGPAGAAFATVVTSAIFALMHAGQLAHAWGPVGVLFCVSLALCYIRLKTASVACSALVHASYNGFLFAGFLLATGGFRHLDKIKM